MSKILKRNNLTRILKAFILGLAFLLLAAPGFNVEAVAASSGSVSVSGSTVKINAGGVTLDSTWTINGSGGNSLPSNVTVSNPSGGSLPNTISTIDLNGNTLTIDANSNTSSFWGLNIVSGNVTVTNSGSSGSIKIDNQGITTSGEKPPIIHGIDGIECSGGSVTLSDVDITVSGLGHGGVQSSCVVAAGGNVVINNGSNLVGNPAVLLRNGNITITGATTNISNVPGGQGTTAGTGSAFSAVSTISSAKGTINIEDGTISNASSNGAGGKAGVSAVGINAPGVTLNVSGGLIQGSTTGGAGTNYGDGISISDGTLNLSSGTVSGYGSPNTDDSNEDTTPSSGAGIYSPPGGGSPKINITGGKVTSEENSSVLSENSNTTTTVTEGTFDSGNGSNPVSGDGKINLPGYSAEDEDGNIYYGESVEDLNNLLEANGVNPNDVVFKPTGDQDFQIPGMQTVSSVSLGDQFLTYYQLANSQNAKPNAGLSYNVNNLRLTILPTTAFANSLEWTIKSLSGSNSAVPEFPDSLNSNGSSNWETDTSKSTGQSLMSLTSEDGAWSIQQIVTKNPNNPKAPLTPGNTYLCYNGDGGIDAGLYELTASAPNNSNATDSIRFIVTGNTVEDVNIVKPTGQGNPLTFDITDRSYDFEFETIPQDAPANVVEWSLEIPNNINTGYEAEDYAYINPETGNMTFLQATPPGVFLELSVTVNGVPSSNTLVIQLTGQWTVEEGIAAYLNPVTVQSNQAYDLADNIVATPTYVPIGDTDFLTFDLPDDPPGVILTPAGRLIPQNTNYSGTVTVEATYNDGTTISSTTFNVIFTPRAVAATQVTAAPTLDFVISSPTSQNVLASLLPKGSGSTPGTTTQVTSTSFTYETSDPSVATVDSYGNVRPVSEGTATITTTLNNGITLVPPTGTTLAEVEVAKTQVTVTNTPAQVPATGITVEPNSPIYLSPVGVNGGTHEQTVTVTLTPENTTDSVTAESSNTGVATVTGEGNSFRVSAVSDGNTTVTFTAGNASATVPVSVNSEDFISSGLTYSADSPDTFSITAGGVMVNPAIPSLEGTTVENVTFMAWSGPDQGDMQTFTVNSSGNNSFSSGTFTVNGNDRYFYNADNIFVEAYANNSQVYLGSLSPNYDWINTSTAGSNDTVAYITYQENNGFNTPTVFNGATSGVTGKNLQLEGIRVSSNIEGVDVVTDVHLQDLGWVEAVNDGVYAGTQHQARQMEAIRLRLAGDNAINYDIWAQGHVQNTGWMQPVKLGNNIDFVGTTGKALQLEAVKIQIVPKGQTPAGWQAFN